jgi:hypothetical protein
MDNSLTDFILCAMQAAVEARDANLVVAEKAQKELKDKVLRTFEWKN